MHNRIFAQYLKNASSILYKILKKNNNLRGFFTVFVQARCLFPTMCVIVGDYFLKLLATLA